MNKHEIGKFWDLPLRRLTFVRPTQLLAETVASIESVDLWMVCG